MKKLMTKEEVAELFGVSPRTIEGWVQAKRIPYYRLGLKTVRFDPDEILGERKVECVKRAKRLK